MARGTTLTNLLAMLKGQLGVSPTAVSATGDSELKTLLSNQQKLLATEYKPKFLQDRWDLAVPAFTNYIALPTVNTNGQTVSIDFEAQLPTVFSYFSGQYQQVVYGIDEDDYNALDWVNRKDTSDPIQKWREATNSDEGANQSQIEIWPVNTTAQVLRFTGQRALLPLVNGTDTADLDDMLLVLSVAVPKLTREKQADAQYQLTLLTRRLGWIKQGNPSKDKQRCLGNQGSGRGMRRNVGMLIAVK